MAARIVLVTGGCRSGKSSHAKRMVEGNAGRKVFLATCPEVDAEMAERVRRHREERKRGGWETLEEEIDLAGALAGIDPEASVLVDCLTLWISNVLFRAGNAGAIPGEDELAARAAAVVRTCRGREGLTVFVANEVGLGIAPENPLARRFRDLAGRVNQVVAAGADEAYFMASGLPVRLK